jgi:hypothetical protein
MLRDDSIYLLFKDLSAYLKSVEFNISPTGEDDRCVFAETTKDVKKSIGTICDIYLTLTGTKLYSKKHVTIYKY